MRVAFAGTPAFAATALSRILDAGFAVPLVLTRPDQPAGRGMKTRPSAVKALAATRGMRLLQPATLKHGPEVGEALGTEVDALVVAAYGLILPAAVLHWPRLGCINIHASLLPRWRGAAPIERALMAGDSETGITIMRMDEGLDTGPMLDVFRVSVAPRETTGTLRERLADAGAEAIVQTLRRLASGESLPGMRQPLEGVTYATKLGRAETRVDWTASAESIDRQIRALDPDWGAATTIAGLPVKLRSAECLPSRTGAAAVVLEAGADGIVVACGSGALRVRELQPAGGRRMDAAAYLAGHVVPMGARLGDEPQALPRAPGKPSG